MSNFCGHCGRNTVGFTFCPQCGRRVQVNRAAGASYGSTYDTGPSLGVDVTDGDPVLNLGGGIGEDLRTGEIEFEILPGLDIPLD
jgi:hypothetical protein